MFELHSLYIDVPTKKRSCKEGLINSSGPKSLKIIFALLAKVVAVHVQFTIIYIWHLSFKRLFMLCWRLARSLVKLYVSFYELFEQFIGRERSRSRSQSKGGSWNPKDSRGRSESIASFVGGFWCTFCKLIFTA